MRGKEAMRRLDVCKKCDRFSKIRQCKECGCFMDLKTLLKKAKCPHPSGDKWKINV